VTPRIILPTYQERDSITGLLAELRRQLGPAARILVVDDGSPDGTAGLVQQVVARDPAVELLSRPGKLGLASADQTALRRVLDENRDDCVVTMDADFSHHPRYVPPLVGAAAAYDLVIGSRYVAGGGIDNWDARRRLLSLIGNWYARTVTGDPGPRSDRGPHLHAHRLPADGAVRAHRGPGLEIPIRFIERRFGHSKLSRNIVYEGLVEPWRIRRQGSTLEEEHWGGGLASYLV